MVSRRYVILVLEIVEEWLVNNPNFDSGDLVNNHALIDEICCKIVDTMGANVQ